MKLITLVDTANHIWGVNPDHIQAVRGCTGPGEARSQVLFTESNKIYLSVSASEAIQSINDSIMRVEDENGKDKD